MLSSLFQESDSILFMESDVNKFPYGVQLRSPASLPDPAPAYYAINPINGVTNRNEAGKKSIRASINVSAYRNFLFEMDSLPLDVQLKVLQHIHTKIQLAQVTYSGSASYHAIISVADTLPFQPYTESGIAQYSLAWQALESHLTQLCLDFDGPAPAFDRQCKDPARLSRTPGALRPDNNVLQSEVSGFGGLISSDFVLSIMNAYSDKEPTYYQPSNPDSPNEKGLLSKRTRDFLNGWKPELAHVWPWHPDFIFAVKDLQSQNYSFDEAYKVLSTVTGYLDENDLFQMKDVWSRNNFQLSFRKKA